MDKTTTFMFELFHVSSEQGQGNNKQMFVVKNAYYHSELSADSSHFSTYTVR